MVEWEQVAQLHSDEYSDLLRTAEALKRKFNAIIKKAPPTGNPECPQYVRDALIARRLIIEKTEASDGGSDLDRLSEFEGSSDDEEEDDDADDDNPLFAEDVEVAEGNSNVVAQPGEIDGVETRPTPDAAVEINDNFPVPSLPPLQTHSTSKVGAQSAEDQTNLVPQSSTGSTPSPRINKLSTSSVKKRKVERGAKSSSMVRADTVRADTGSSSDEVLGAKYQTAGKKKRKSNSNAPTKRSWHSSKKKNDGKKPKSTAFTTPVRKSKKGIYSSSPSDSSAIGSGLQNKDTTNHGDEQNQFQSIMTFMMLQTKNETEQKNRDIETRKEEMRMHREEMAMQRQMMNMMMMSMMGTNNNNGRAGPRNNLDTSNVDRITEDNRKPAAKKSEESEMEDGAAEC